MSGRLVRPIRSGFETFFVFSFPCSRISSSIVMEACAVSLPEEPVSLAASLSVCSSTYHPLKGLKMAEIKTQITFSESILFYYVLENLSNFQLNKF